MEPHWTDASRIKHAGIGLVHQSVRNMWDIRLAQRRYDSRNNLNRSIKSVGNRDIVFIAKNIIEEAEI